MHWWFYGVFPHYVSKVNTTCSAGHLCENIHPALLSFPPHADAVFRSGRSGPIWTDMRKFSRHSSGTTTPLIMLSQLMQGSSATEHRNCRSSLNISSYTCKQQQHDERQNLTVEHKGCPSLHFQTPTSFHVHSETPRQSLQNKTGAQLSVKCSVSELLRCRVSEDTRLQQSNISASLI